MKITMSGIDFHTASLETREKLSITEKELGVLAKKIKEEHSVSGCVLLSTCNRTEIYVTPLHACGYTPSEILCSALGVDHGEFGRSFTTRRGSEAIRHVMELSAGLHSQVFGDDQIIAQVKRAWQAAHDADTADSCLETLFRQAVTAGKKVKTNVKLNAVGSSVAYLAVEVLKKEFGDLHHVKGMVIGNGEIGRLAAGILVDEGADVTLTIREYKYKPIVTPLGCQTIMYSQRYTHANTCRFVISATTSPHHTVTKEELKKLEQVPAVFIDLAVPRDIESSVSDLGAKVYNVDDLGAHAENKIGLHEAMLIIDEYEQKYNDWYKFKKSAAQFSNLEGLNI